MGPNGEDKRGANSEVQHRVSKPKNIAECEGRYAVALQRVLAEASLIFKRYAIEIPQEIVSTYQERAADKAILSCVFEKLCAAQDGDPPIKVLEIGAGPTLSAQDQYGHIPDESSPWLSRALKRAFGSLIDITVSDIQPEYFQFMVVLTNEGRYVAHCCVTPPTPSQGDFFNPYVDTFPRVEHLAAQQQSSKSSSLEALLANVISDEHGVPLQFQNLLDWYERESAGSLKPLQIQVIPVLLPALEQAVYQVQSRTEVDMQRLGEHFASDAFDIVFGRHLFPIDSQADEVYQRIQAGLEQVLRCEGEGILFFDDLERKELRYRKTAIMPQLFQFEEPGDV